MTPLRPKGARGLVWVALLSMAWLAATAWTRPLMLPDEGRYVGVAWEMLRSGDWLTPTLNGLPYFHKPPLFYWITASSLSLFGVNEWAARAAPLLGAGLGALAPYLFVRRWADERSARLALIALLVQPLFYIGGQFANLDMLVAGCITATIVLLAHAALSVERGLPYRRALVGAYAFAAAGVLAKGLIGAVIPALVIGAWLVTLRRWQGLRALIWAPGVVIFVAIVGPWFVAMQQRFTDFLDYFFVVQHFKRFAAGGFNNVQPFWFYPAVLLLLSLPWLPWLARIVRRGYLTHHDGDGLDARGPIRWLMLLWIGVVVAFFSLPQSKLLGYVLPAVPPLAVLMADALTGLGTTSRRAVRLWWTSAAVSAVVSVGAVAALVIYPLHSSRDLGRALAAQRSQSDAVFMLGNYYFDVPFYAGLRDVITVVEAWDSPDVPLRDNWRKELADAAAFAPPRSATRLVTPVMLPTALCIAPVDWIIGPTTAVSQYPVLALARVIFRQRDTTLWRLDSNQPQVASALRCSGTPNDG